MTPTTPMHSTPRRLFLGLMPGGMTQMAIADHRSYWQWDEGCILPSPRRMHLTLHFLGDLDARREAMLLSALEQVRFEGPIRLACTTQQVWSNGVAVLLPEPSEELDALRDALGFAMFQAALPLPPKKWVPHVTLARRAHQALPPEAAPPVNWEVRDYALVWSKSPGTPKADYETVARFPIAQPPVPKAMGRRAVHPEASRGEPPVTPSMPAASAPAPWRPVLAA